MLYSVANRASVIELAAHYGLPAVYAFRNMAVEGGLMLNWVDVANRYRRSAAYVDRILGGALAGRVADPGTDPLRARPQPEGSQVDWPRSISRVPAAHGRGDRMRRADLSRWSTRALLDSRGCGTAASPPRQNTGQGGSPAHTLFSNFMRCSVTSDMSMGELLILSFSVLQPIPTA